MSYSLPPDVYSGTIAGIAVSYNDKTQQFVFDIGIPTLKRLLEDYAVRAALERGFYCVTIL